jgi:hypothetical protein
MLDAPNEARKGASRADEDIFDDLEVVAADDVTDAFGVNVDDIDGESEIDDGGGGMTGDAGGAGFSTSGHAPESSEAPDAAPMTGTSDGAPFSAQGTGALTSSETSAAPASGFDVATGQPLPEGGTSEALGEVVEEIVTHAVEHGIGEAAAHALEMSGGPVGEVISGVLSMDGHDHPTPEPAPENPDAGATP